MIWDYLNYNKKGVFLYLASTAVFAALFFLNNVRLDLILYGGLLCLIIAVFFAGFDFHTYKRQHKALQDLVSTIDAQIEHLPEPRNIIDGDYSEIIFELYRQKREIESQAYNSRQELLDYFTLWTHQVKTPIAAINLIQQSKGSNATKQDKALSLELFYIEEYVNTALSYIRFGDMSGDFLFEKVELDALIRQSLRKYAHVFINKKVTVCFQETGKRIVTDQKWLLVVLGQLLSNSLKYTKENGKISIFMEENRLIVADTGIGIKEEDLPRIFEKGFTGYNGRLHSKSTGQGLYLCKNIMGKLSHQIHAESSEGEGTRMILSFSKETFQ